MAFKRQEREAAASIMAGDRYCPDPSAHEHRAASQERPHDNHDGCNPYDPAHIAGKAPASQERPQPPEGRRLDGVEVTEEHVTEGTETATGGREAVARWMIEHGYATGHGDTLDDLLTELASQERHQPGQWGSDAAEWHRYLHQGGMLVEDEGEDCGPWHHRVFLGESAPASQERPSIDVERLAALLRDHCHDSIDEGLPILLRHKHLAPFVRDDCAAAIARGLSGPVVVG